MKTLITHNGGFHADDVFASATLLLVYPDAKIIRTRDPEIIKTGDIVFDVGRVYDGEKFFDHHQEGGAGKRENGIPYASFGLIWKKFGGILFDAEALKYVDQKLVSTIDAIDNGVDLGVNSKVNIFSVSDVIGSFNLVGHEGKEDASKHDEAFYKALAVATEILKRVMVEAKDFSESLSTYKKAYEEAEDKRLVVTDKHISKECLTEIPDVIYVVHPYHNNTWTVRAVRKDPRSFENKKSMPEDWAGKEGEVLQKITGVSDAIFCHNARFFANAKSKEGAIALARLALEN